MKWIVIAIVLYAVFALVLGALLGMAIAGRNARREASPWQAARDRDARTKAFMRSESMVDRIPTTSSVADIGAGHVRVRKADMRNGGGA